MADVKEGGNVEVLCDNKVEVESLTEEAKQEGGGVETDSEVKSNGDIKSSKTDQEVSASPDDTNELKVPNGDCTQPVKEKKSGRRVSFHSNVIYGYHEPPVPWNNVSDCSTEELVAAYKKSCVKHDVKPLPKLQQQLHVITNFHDRNETLTLRGESLNIRHIETLEEVLRRVQFRTIDLEASHLDEESAIAMFDMIEFYQSAIRVNISYNKIGLRGWQSCSRMLKKTLCIQHLDARCCSLTEQVLPLFGRALRLGSMLKILHLENSIMSGRSLMILVAAIKMNEILEELFLADNKLMPSDGIQLGNLLKFNHKLRLLDVRNNHLGDVGTTHISDGLYEQSMGHGLETLVLWNNQITYQSMASLGRALKSTSSIETINLGHNNVTNEGIHRLKDGLMHNQSLMRIGLQAAKISCEGAVALAECIAESLKLVRLDLRENDVKTGGLMALSLALKVNNSVNRIDIDQNPKKESGIKDFADQQRRLLQDINNFSQRNRDLTLRREEEERQRKLEEEMQAALRECEEAVEETEIQESKKEPNQVHKESAETVLKPEISAEVNSSNKPTNEGEKKQEADTDQHPLRLQLHLPIPSRSQSLDSPVDTPEISYPPLKIPPTVMEQGAGSPVKDESPLPPEFPPSPMVSHEGKTIHALVTGKLGIPLLMEPETAEDDKQSKQESTDSVKESTVASGNNNNKNILSPSKKKGSNPRTPSPSNRRKFTISRVEEPVKYGIHSNTVAQSGDPLGVVTDSEIKTLSGKPQQKVHLPDTAEGEMDNSPTKLEDLVEEKEENSVEKSEKEDVTSSLNRNDNCDELKTTRESEKSSGQNASCENSSPLSKQNNTNESPQTNNPSENQDNQVDGDSNNTEPLKTNNNRHSAIQTSCDSDLHKNLQQTVASSSSGVQHSHDDHSINKMSGMDDGASASCSDESNIVSLNGVRIDVGDLLEGEGDSASSSLDLLSSADDFEKELDDMLANVQGSVNYTPEVVPSEGSS